MDGERLASGHVEQSLHVAEVAIDRGRLHPGGGAHRSRGYRVPSATRQQFGGGDWITVVTNATGTFTGDMTLADGTVVSPTGKAFDLEFAQTSKWDGDQLIVISAFWDTALQAKQLGLPQ